MPKRSEQTGPRGGGKKPAPQTGRFFLVTLSPEVHWEIISKRRMVNPTFSMRSWLPYLIDLIFIGVFTGLYFGPLQDLAQFRAGIKIIKIDPLSARLISCIGFYAILGLPVRIAVFRRHRMPQIAEWLSMYFGFAWAALFLLFGGVMLNIYAGLDGYTHCFNDNAFAIYAHAPAACPQLDAWQKQNDSSPAW